MKKLWVTEKIYNYSSYKEQESHKKIMKEHGWTLSEDLNYIYDEGTEKEQHQISSKFHKYHY